MERILACPKSVKLSEGVESVDNDYTKEGTEAHAIAEEMLRGSDFLDSEETPEVLEMVTHAQVYADLISWIENANLILDSWVERTLVSRTIENFGGTPDWHAVSADTVFIVDYKYGQGIAVSAKDNAQLKSYFVLAQELHPRAEKFEGWICQPRMKNTSKVTLTAEEVGQFRYELLEACVRIKDAPLESGSHCRWCPVLATCPKLRQDALDLVDDIAECRVPITKQMELLPVLRALTSVIPAAALVELQSGGRIPGYKAVQKLGPRKWTADEAVEAKLRKAQVPLKVFMPRKLLSPTQLEKAGLLRHATELVTRKELGLTVVPEDDNRPDALGHTLIDVVEEADNG